MLVAVLDLAADPREAVPAPDCSIVHFAETINAARRLEAMRHSLRRVVRFADYSNHQSVMLTESVSVPKHDAHDRRPCLERGNGVLQIRDVRGRVRNDLQLELHGAVDLVSRA